MDSPFDFIITGIAVLAATFSLTCAVRAIQERKRTAPPSWRKLQAGEGPQPTEHRNLTVTASQEQAPSARQSTAKFYPRTSNYTTKKK
jgi:hypothetical protein